MPLLNVIVEDGSPLISYVNGNWIDSPTSDPNLTEYSAKSYHICSSNSGKVQFSFNGTSVSMVGGKGPKYGTYTIQIDNGEPIDGDSFSETREVNQTLGGTDNLPFGAHTITLTLTAKNQSHTSVDLDFIAFGIPVGGDNDVISTKSLGPNDTSITYFPNPASWSVDQSTGFQSRFSTRSQANVSTSFFGDIVAVYGPTGPSQGEFLVNLDGQVTRLNSRAGAKHDPALLFFMPSLSPAMHNISVIDNSGQQFGFSGFEFFQANPAPPTPTTSSDSGSSTDGPIAPDTPFTDPNGGFTPFQPTATSGSQSPLGSNGLTPINPSSAIDSGNTLSGSRLAGVVVAAVIFTLVMVGFLYRILRLRNRPSNPFDDRRRVSRTYGPFNRFFNRDVESTEPDSLDSMRDSLNSNQSDLFVPVQRPPPTLMSTTVPNAARWRDQSQQSISEYRGGGARY